MSRDEALEVLGLRRIDKALFYEDNRRIPFGDAKMIARRDTFALNA